MIQLKAGYFTNAMESLRSNASIEKKVKLLMEQLSYFDLESNIEIKDECSDAATALLYNIVSRGTPTYPSQFIEDILSTTIGKTLKRISKDGTIFREIPKREVQDLVFRALHVIEPRQKAEKSTSEDPRLQFIYDYITYGAVFSQGDYIWQLAEIDRNFDNIFKYSKKFRRNLKVLKANPEYDFLNEKCDLTFSAPYSENTADCITYGFNLDDSLVDTTDWIRENMISSLLNKINITGRVIIKKSDILSHKTDELNYFTQNPYFDIVRDNYNSPLFNSEDGIEALQIALTPLAIARIQKVILEAVNSGALSLTAKTWKIGVIERDVPCAFLALEDLKQHFNKFFTLENCARKFPNVKLEIFHTQEFAETELNLLYQGSREDISEFDENKEYDLLIDVSVLSRFSFNNEIPKTKSKKYAVIRSAKSPSVQTKLLKANYIHYDIDLTLPQEEEEDDNEENFNEQEDALKFFLKNLFAKNDFLKGQAKSISELLNGNNLLHISPPGTGKTLISLFACLMKPGYSFVLSPTIAVMDMQFDMLRDRKIDIDYYLNPALQNSLDRDLAARSVTQGRSLITFFSPSLIHDPYIRKIFKQIDSKAIPIYYIMLDEAQRISLQTSDFRPYYQDIKNIIAKNFSDENINTLRIGAFTSTPEKNIQNEIVQKLQIDCIERVNAENIGKIDLSVHEIQMRGAGNTDDLQAYAKKLKQVQAEKILMQSKNQNLKALIYSLQCPFDKNENHQIGGFNSDYYEGDIVELDRQITSSQALEGRRAFKNFKDGASKILAASRSIGTGIRIKDLTDIIYFEPPLSLESFCRMNGRGSLNSEIKVNLMLNISEKDFAGFESIRDNNGKLTTAENITATDFDTAANLQNLLNQNPGPEKEKTILKEILNGVSFPQYSLRQIVTDAVFNEFGFEIQTETEPAYNPNSLYIYTQQKTKSLGFINFKDNSLNMPEMQYDKEISEKVQTFILDLINNSTDNPLAYLSVMETEQSAEENDGIQTALDAVMEGQKAKITIPFYNDIFREGAQMLNSILGTNTSATILRRCYSKTFNYDEFEKVLAKDYEIRIKNLGEGKRFAFRELYNKFRNKADTLRAISRLKEIDLIDDYLINPAKEEIEVYVTKHNKDFYKMKLMPVLQRNLTREKMLLYFSGIEEEKFLSLEKYTDTLIDFFYTEIYPLYERAAKDSGKFFRTVLEKQKDGTLTQEEIMKNLQNYFISRYKCDFVCDEIPENADKVDGVLYLIDKAGSNLNELTSLRESVSENQKANSKPADKIMYGYCKLFTGANSDYENRFEAYQSISEGLTQIRENESEENFINNLDSITEKIASENYDLKEESQAVLLMKIQHNWLKRFNSEVLKINERK